jgi:hypothetical protein
LVWYPIEFWFVVLSGLHCAGCFGCVFLLALVWFCYRDNCSIRVLQKCWCWRMVQWFLSGLGVAVWIVIVEIEFVFDGRDWWYLV